MDSKHVGDDVLHTSSRGDRAKLLVFAGLTLLAVSFWAPLSVHPEFRLVGRAPTMS